MTRVNARTAAASLAASPARGGPPPVAFVYHGPSASPAGVSRKLYKTQPVFRDAIDECRRHLDEDEAAEFSPESSSDLFPGAELRPAFVLAYAATRLVRSWGVAADERAGHWLGDAVAACIEGDLPLGEALDYLKSVPAEEAGDSAEPSPFAADWRTLASHGYRLFVEIGPPPADAERRDADGAPDDVVRLALFGDALHEKSRHWQCAATLYAHGVAIDWPAFFGKAPPRLPAAKASAPESPPGLSQARFRG